MQGRHVTARTRGALRGGPATSETTLLDLMHPGNQLITDRILSFLDGRAKRALRSTCSALREAVLRSVQTVRLLDGRWLPFVGSRLASDIK